MAESNRSDVRLRTRHMINQRQERFLLSSLIVGAMVLAGSLALFHQSNRSPAIVEQHPRNDLSRMPKATLPVKNLSFWVWLARTPLERELGLMCVRPEEMADNQGMLFIFEDDQAGGFWMRNTLLPLDIAFLRPDGTVVDIQQMEPLSLVSHAPRGPYRYGLEVRAGSLARASLQIGDVVPIPEELLNP